MAEHESSCAEVADELELHALHALDPSDDDRVAEHLVGCPACRARVADAEAALGLLLEGVEPVEAPAGFTERVVAARRGARATALDVPVDTEVPARSPVPSRAPTVRRVALVAASVAVVVTLAAGLWWARTRDEAPVAAPTTTASVVRQAALVAADGTAIGRVTVTSGTDADLTMSVDRVPAGIAYDCVVRTADGSVATVGTWAAAEPGPASWSVALDPSLAPVEEVRLVLAGADPGTEPVATARPA